MSNAVTALTTTVTANSLWAVFEGVVPFIGITVTVALGYYLLRKLIKGVSHMKQR